MKKTSVSILLAMSFIVACSASIAQTSAFIDLDQTWQGNGYVSGADIYDTVKSVRVILRTSKNAEITLKGSRTTLINAKWSGDPERRVYLDVTKALNDSFARGDGSIIFDNGRLERLSINGQARNRKFVVVFSETGNVSRPPTDFPDRPSVSFSGLDEVRSGGGLLEREGRALDSLRKTYVKLERNGRAELRFDGREKYTFIGKWSEASDRRVRIDIERAFGSNSVSGYGQVYLDTRFLLDRIELQGRHQGDRFKLNFKVGASPPQTDFREFNDTAYGRGTMLLNNDKFDEIRMVKVELDRYGNARIRTEGKRPQVITGRWSGQPEMIKLKIAKVSSITGADGNGTLYVRRDQIERLEISGRHREGRYSISFRAR